MNEEKFVARTIKINSACGRGVRFYSDAGVAKDWAQRLATATRQAWFMGDKAVFLPGAKI